MTRTPPPCRTSPRGARGFTLLEILVTLAVIAIGVLGTASLQALALKINQGGQLRSQAVILGLDLIERIEANNVAAIAGSYAPASLPTSAAKDCVASYCSPSELATYDLVQFKTRMEAQLPAATATIAVSGSGPFTYTIQINWQERIARASDTALETTGTTTVTGGGQIESFSYTVSKMFANRSLVV